MKLLKLNISKLVFLFIFFSCVEPVDIETITFEDYLVVEASITNELKKHTVKLSRTFEINQNTENNETGANVVIIDSQGSRYQFEEISAGEYESVNEFTAEQNTEYTLEITTKTGDKYISTAQKLTPEAQIEKLTTSVQSSIEGFQGVEISVESFSVNNNSYYYRFTYEETYKISPPFWSDEELSIVSDRNPFRVEVIKRSVDNKDCYKTINSSQLILTETKSLAEDRVNFPVRFILDTDFIISKRYSILVKQYVQTFEAYTYFNTLKKLSSSENVFNQAQPGFISGNIVSENNQNEKVIGFFEVSSVSEKRMFFNYHDIFPNQSIYFPDSCDFVAPIIFDPFTGDSPLINLIKDNSYTYYRENDTGLDYLEGNYLLVPKICGDCTVLGSNIKPTFWVD
jgi:hypothetical protein